MQTVFFSDKVNLHVDSHGPCQSFVNSKKHIGNYTQFQFGAKSNMIGTGIPNNHPKINTLFPIHLLDILPAKRFRIAFTNPKLAIKDTINTFDWIPNSLTPISGTTVCSNPIIEPTNALTKTRIKNYIRLGRKPNLIGF